MTLGREGCGGRGGGAGSWLRSAVASGSSSRLPRLPDTAMLIPCYLAIALHLQPRTTTGSTPISTNRPSACPTALSPRWDTRTNPAGTLPNACAPGSGPRSAAALPPLPDAHGCDTAPPVAARWRRRPRRTRRRQPRSRACAPPCRRRLGPAGPQHNEEPSDGVALLIPPGRPAPTPWSEGQQGTLSSGVRGRVGHN